MPSNINHHLKYINHYFLEKFQLCLKNILKNVWIFSRSEDTLSPVYGKQLKELSWDGRCSMNTYCFICRLAGLGQVQVSFNTLIDWFGLQVTPLFMKAIFGIILFLIYKSGNTRYRYVSMFYLRRFYLMEFLCGSKNRIDCLN